MGDPDRRRPAAALLRGRRQRRRHRPRRHPAPVPALSPRPTPAWRAVSAARASASPSRRRWSRPWAAPSRSSPRRVSARGSRSSLPLPRSDDPLPPAGPARARPVERDALRGLAVLVADDAPLNQKLALQMLVPLGAAVDVVADGVAAVAAVGRRDYALVLMDMEMPVMDGPRRDAPHPGAWRVPPGACRSWPSPPMSFPSRSRSAGPPAWTTTSTKPFGPDDLAAKALRWARASPDSAGAAAARPEVADRAVAHRLARQRRSARSVSPTCQPAGQRRHADDALPGMGMGPVLGERLGFEAVRLDVGQQGRQEAAADPEHRAGDEAEVLVAPAPAGDLAACSRATSPRFSPQ